MKRWLKINGQLIELDDLLNEENWSPPVRAISYILFVLGVGATFFLILYLGVRP